MDDFIIYGLAAAKQAVRDSGWVATSDEDKYRTGVLIGSGIGGLDGIEQASILVHEKGRAGCRRSSFRPADQPGVRLCLHRAQFQGPSLRGHRLRHGAHAIGDAAR